MLYDAEIEKHSNRILFVSKCEQFQGLMLKSW